MSNILIAMQLGSVRYWADVAKRIQVDILLPFYTSMVCAAIIAHLTTLDWIAR